MTDIRARERIAELWLNIYGYNRRLDDILNEMTYLGKLMDLAKQELEELSKKYGAKQ